MIVFPAIDLLDGQCVRLYRGEYQTAEQVAPDPVSQAKAFAKAGATWLHTVDLNGARGENNTPNGTIMEEMVRASGLKYEIGGGVRSRKTVEEWLERGASRVILGSAALRDPALVREVASLYGDKIAVGIDCRDGFVSVEGWTEKSDVQYLEFASRMEEIGVSTLILTDIARDGMLSGPNLEMLGALSEAVSCQIIASGGVRDLHDIRALKELSLYGAIAGRSLYAGTLSLPEALALAGENEETQC